MNRDNDEKTSRIEEIHAALRVSIKAVKLLADDADGLLKGRRDLPADEIEAAPKPRIAG